MKKVDNVAFTTAAIDGNNYILFSWYTGARGYAKVCRADSHEYATAYAGGWGYDKRGAAVSKALKKLGIDRDENFANKFLWREVL